MREIYEWYLFIVKLGYCESVMNAVSLNIINVQHCKFFLVRRFVALLGIKEMSRMY